MNTTLEDANAALRSAVKSRLDGTPKDDPKMVEHAQPTTENYSEWVPAFQPRTRAEQTLQSAIDAVRDRNGRYGPPTEHFGRTAALVNAAFGTKFTPADWALVMVLDKVARQLGPEATDDSAVDIAGYAACHQECRYA